MAHITAMTTSKRSADHVVVKVDGKAVATLSTHSVAELGLHIEAQWTEALADRVNRAQGVDRAKLYAMRSLGRRAQSRRQLARRLLRKEHAQEAIDAALDRLEAVGLIDDEAFGRALIREATRAKPAGARLLRTKLYKAGLGDALIGQLLAEFEGEPADAVFENAVELARKRLAMMAKLDAPARKRRLWGLLARRGFDYDAIERIFRRIDLK